jgi:SAM-dependent methyltransferase
MSPLVCRYCGASLDCLFADLGETPLANSFMTGERIALHSETKHKLRLYVCSTCRLVQTDITPLRESIFDQHYPYFSSFSTSWVAHAEAYADSMIERFGLGPRSLVVEVASNDGYLLRHFVARGIPAFGVEPAENAARTAMAVGVPTEIGFFGIELAERLRAENGTADVIAANNVLAHVPDLHDFLGGFARLLGPQGVATFEFPHLLNLIKEAQFDTIYHEHYSYLSLLLVERALGDVGLRVFDVEHLATHGGSLRVFAAHRRAIHADTNRVADCRRLEAAAHLDRDEGYAGFQACIERARTSFHGFLEQARRRSKRISAYGAAAKGNTFLNVCGATVANIMMVADRNPEKQGKLLPGSHIPVVTPEALIAARPDYVVILPWNLAAEIRTEMGAIETNGGRFVVGIPETRILS